MIAKAFAGYPMSRTASTNTVTQIQKHSLATPPRSPSNTHPSFSQRRQSREAMRRSIDASPKQGYTSLERGSSPIVIADDSSSSSSSESDAPRPISRSRAFVRRPRYMSSKVPLNPLSDADEEHEDSPPFLPFSDARTVTPPPGSDPGATLKISPKRSPSHQGDGSSLVETKPFPASQTVHSSSSSVQSQPQLQNRNPHNALATLSPRQRRIAKEGSDGTPSMGSSFSDLDDASVTQSALEEALANEMTQGGVASRMSTISQALRSRYL